MKQGWQCPGCLRIYSPDVRECNCSNSALTASCEHQFHDVLINKVVRVCGRCGKEEDKQEAK